jgi:hypothetical protein
MSKGGRNPQNMEQRRRGLGAESQHSAEVTADPNAPKQRPHGSEKAGGRRKRGRKGGGRGGGVPPGQQSPFPS